MRRLSVRPSASFVIATMALTVALGGTGYAATKINGSTIVKHSIAGNRLKSNTLTGAQIKESSLGTVPKAKSAKTATTAGTVNGHQVDTFNITLAQGGSSQTVYLPGAVLSAYCSGTPGVTNLDLANSSTAVESYVVEGADVASGGTPFATHDASLTTTDADSLSPGAATTGAGTAVIQRPASGVTTITFAYQQDVGGGCTYSGTAIATK
jgi:hypothetical protein